MSDNTIFFIGRWLVTIFLIALVLGVVIACTPQEELKSLVRNKERCSQLKKEFEESGIDRSKVTSWVLKSAIKNCEERGFW